MLQGHALEQLFGLIEPISLPSFLRERLEGSTMAASVEACQKAYRELLGMARQFAGSDDEARDLVQDAVLIALARGFDDWSAAGRRGWLRGVVRKRAAFVLRGQKRRRRREELPDGVTASGASRWVWQADFLASLPRSLRVVATLASADLCAAEIRWLLALSDTALRQRLTALRRAVGAEGELPTQPASEPQLSLGGRRAQPENHQNRGHLHGSEPRSDPSPLRRRSRATRYGHIHRSCQPERYPEAFAAMRRCCSPCTVRLIEASDFASVSMPVSVQ